MPGRPVDVLQLRDGSLLVSDNQASSLAVVAVFLRVCVQLSSMALSAALPQANVVYRISYRAT